MSSMVALIQIIEKLNHTRSHVDIKACSKIGNWWKTDLD